MPPRTAARACSATRTTLTSGCWAVSVDPAVWVWKRIRQERGSLAPKRSRMISAQSERAARNLAISSKKFECALKKNEIRGAKESTARPRAIAASTYAIPLARVKATSWTAVEPASRMWYPETEIVFQRGTSRPQNSKMSVAILSDGRGGKM